MASSQRLEAAAKELVKAAYLDIKEDGESKAVGKTVAAIRAGNDHLSNLEKQVVSMKESMDAKINTLNQNVDNLKEQMEEVKKTVTNQTKLQNLSWAIHNSKMNEFTYYESRGSIESGELVRKILFSFRRGFGHYLPDEAYLQQPYYLRDEAEKKKSASEFRTQLIDQIHALTGQKPRIVAENSRFAIYYS